MLNEKDYCDKNLTAVLKNLGFPTKMVFIGEQATIEIPINSGLIQLYEAQKWLREEKKIDANAFYDNMDAAWRFYILEIDSPDLSGTYAYNDAYMSYEEALSEGLRAAIKLLKEK